MQKENKLPVDDMWQWKDDAKFSNTVAVGDQVFISGQQTLDKDGVVLNPGDIAAQTRNVFENMKSSLVGLNKLYGTEPCRKRD